MLFTEEASPSQNSHGEVIGSSRNKRCDSDDLDDCLYLGEDNIPDWIREVVDRVKFQIK